MWGSRWERERTSPSKARESRCCKEICGDWRAETEPRDDVQYPAEFILRVRLQLARRAYRLRRAVPIFRIAAEPDLRERGHDIQFGLGDYQCAAPAHHQVVNARRIPCYNHAHDTDDGYLRTAGTTEARTVPGAGRICEHLWLEGFPRG